MCFKCSPSNPLLPNAPCSGPRVPVQVHRPVSHPVLAGHLWPGGGAVPREHPGAVPVHPLRAEPGQPQLGDSGLHTGQMVPRGETLSGRSCLSESIFCLLGNPVLFLSLFVSSVSILYLVRWVIPDLWFCMFVHFCCVCFAFTYLQLNSHVCVAYF